MRRIEVTGAHIASCEETPTKGGWFDDERVMHVKPFYEKDTYLLILAKTWRRVSA